MDHFLPLFAILGALMLGAISPGPSFVFVVRTAVAQSRTEGLAAALGMGVGAMLYGALAVLGLRTLMQDGGLLFTALKVAGGLYLVYLAWKIWSHAADPITVEAGAAPAANPRKAFTFGLLTQLSNPKIVAVFGAVFAALLPANPEPWLYWALPPLIFLQETLWYAIVAIAFSAAKPRAIYLSAKLWVDRAAAAFIGILGIRLIIDAR
ncbi:threonine transporter [Devosia insulae DS-56]|uniref:Threonine transporter n=1 Tax=Devosia insulae DS-56 TaxID=1116389 RepID=A0A1E5XWK7_9HYPH|nr:LysE family transporter [Devosia insulae]OEO32959.1 threonine transporter [Devosia insulae DS-56]